VVTEQPVLMQARGTKGSTGRVQIEVDTSELEQLMGARMEEQTDATI
jgi:hypothetical protein